MLTIHTVVRNEPFIYYSIKSVYDYVDKILLYDTGSDDYTLEDINTLLKEDTNNKIIFKQVKIYEDETQWISRKLFKGNTADKGKPGVEAVRQMQIDDTDTEFFMILDGDEVYYQKDIERLCKDIAPNMPKGVYCYRIPLIWFYDFQQLFKGIPSMGRIFRTDEIVITGKYPKEMHCIKRENGKRLDGTPYMQLASGLNIGFAHFESVLKPWRRKYYLDGTYKLPVNKDLPEIMINNDFYINRFREVAKKDSKYMFDVYPF